MSHASPIGAEYEIPGETIFTFTASHRSGSQPGNFLANGDTGHICPNLDDRTCKFMPKNHRRVIAKGVVEDVYISSTHAAEANLHLYQVLADGGLRNIKDADVSISGSVFY